MNVWVIFIKLNLEEWDWMTLKLCHKCGTQRRAPSVNRKTMTPLVEIVINDVCDMWLCIWEEKAIISNMLDVLVELERPLNQQAVESCIASLGFPNDNVIEAYDWKLALNTAMMHCRKTERLNRIQNWLGEIVGKRRFMPLICHWTAYPPQIRSFGV